MDTYTQYTQYTPAPHSPAMTHFFSCHDLNGRPVVATQKWQPWEIDALRAATRLCTWVLSVQGDPALDDWHD